MGIRTKILSGFLILAGMLFLAGGWSIYELITIGTSVQRLLDDNYKSINAARLMIEALEREDSAILLLQSGNQDEGRKIIESADLSFQQGFRTAKKNITIHGESVNIDNIERAYNTFKGLWIKPLVENTYERSLGWYFDKVHPRFLDVKSEVETLMSLNDKAMYQTASNLKSRAHKALMPGIVAVLTALVFSIMFNYFVNYYLVRPIVMITNGIQNFLKTGTSFQVRIETKDELHSLAAALQTLEALLKKDERQ